MDSSDKNTTKEIFILSALTIALTCLFHETFVDIWLAGHFYSKTELWIYRNNFFLERVLHKGGVLLIVAILFSMIVKIFLDRKKNDQQLRRYFTFIVISSLITITMVFLFKRWTTLPCPWSSVEFGGPAETPDLWQMFSSKYPPAKCFPAGHSSGGFAFLAAYFGFTFIYGRRNFKTLIPGLLIGVIFGATQEVRGAHYISHDFATIFLSLMANYITILLFLRFSGLRKTLS